MKKLLLVMLLFSLLIFWGGCGGMNEEEEISEGENSEESEESGESEEPEETLEGLDFAIQALEAEFTVTGTEVNPYEMIGAIEGVVLRIGRDDIELYEFDPEDERDVARESIQSALNEGIITIDGEVFSAVYNENQNLMLVDFENHPQGMEIKQVFEDL